MKLATYADGSRDGQLVVVSRDLSQAHYATHIAPHLRALLDDWNFLSPQLEDLSVTLNQGKARHAFPFEPQRCLPPLPRPTQWLRGWTSLWHWRRRQGDETLPPAWLGAPRLAPAATHPLLAAQAPVELAGLAAGLDAEPGLAVITGDVAQGCSPAEALESVRLLMLCADWCLRSLEPGERSGGDGLVQSRPAISCGPVVVTPEEWGDAWQAGRLQAQLISQTTGPSGPPVAGRTDTAQAMDFHFGQLMAVAARHRGLAAGTVLCSGPLCLPPPSSGVDTGHHSWVDLWGGAQGAQAQGLTDGSQLQVDLLDAQGDSPMGRLNCRVATPVTEG